jgi:hypothetical protein
VPFVGVVERLEKCEYVVDFRCGQRRWFALLFAERAIGQIDPIAESRGQIIKLDYPAMHGRVPLLWPCVALGIEAQHLPQ